MKRGLYVGRFQPFHLGHLQVARSILDEADEIIIGIGSAQDSHTPENPFTAGERVLMITAALKTLGKPYYVLPIPDVNRNAIWSAHVASMTPPFKKVYTNNPLVARLFREDGYEVTGTKLFNRNEYSGTEIRRRILHGEDWRSLVPSEVSRIIDWDIRGTERLQDINQKEPLC